MGSEASKKHNSFFQSTRLKMSFLTQTSAPERQTWENTDKTWWSNEHHHGVELKKWRACDGHFLLCCGDNFFVLHYCHHHRIDFCVGVLERLPVSKPDAAGFHPAPKQMGNTIGHKLYVNWWQHLIPSKRMALGLPICGGAFSNLKRLRQIREALIRESVLYWLLPGELATNSCHWRLTTILQR